MATRLVVLSRDTSHVFSPPSKRINEGHDVSLFLVSQAYRDITTFLVQLNRAMFPQKNATIQSPGNISPTVSKLQALIKAIDVLVDEVPLDPGTHRFGNTAFRKWFALLEGRVNRLVTDHLPTTVVEYPHNGEFGATDELQAYLLGSFGSAQRLDYGTGHELSFLAFLAGIWKLGGFEDSKDGSEERSIVLHIIVPFVIASSFVLLLIRSTRYLTLVRKLILKYSLEPAGSHGVWGLDDHSFLPYIFGSAQYGPAINELDPTPTEGSYPSAPSPSSIIDRSVVSRERQSNLYLSAVHFINDVKTGPFWEHSPTLFDISGVTAGWAKINKGMLKMYDAEVLSKFPVVQHFPFGSLFCFDRDPNAGERVGTVHTMSQPRRDDLPVGSGMTTTAVHSVVNAKPGGLAATAAPWARSGGPSLPDRTTKSAGRNNNTS